MKVFDLYSADEIKIEDFGLKKYINVEPKIMLKTRGRNRERFSKVKVNIVERLINSLQVPGHRGKKHKIMTFCAGKFTMNANTVVSAFKIIEQQTNQNPIQILVKAVENAAPKDEVTSIEYGGARYPQAVDCSPTRRINLAIRNIVHGAYDKSFNKKKKIHETLAQEIIAASNNSNESFSVSKRIEVEKQADSAR